MSGDEGDRLRGLARHLDVRAADVAAMAAVLTAAVAGTAWEGPCADDLRADAHLLAADLLRQSTRLAVAAERLRQAAARADSGAAVLAGLTSGLRALAGGQAS